MLKLLERTIASVEQRLVVLAPADVPPPDALRNVELDPARHAQLLREMQRLRGTVYSEDGAVREDQLAPGGLHEAPEDPDAWHLLILDKAKRVTGCIFYIDRTNTGLSDLLRVRNCPLTHQEEWRGPLLKAVEADIARARTDNLQYAEVGGWAVERDSRCTAEGFLLALAAYSFARMCGGALGVTTATMRHGSSSILRRLGLEQIEADGVTLPEYYDPEYGCNMELLRFDSRRSNPRYSNLIEKLRESIANSMVVSASNAWAARRVA